MPIIEIKRPPSRSARNNILAEFGRNIYSQHGEDGIIEQIFRVIGLKSRWCVEFGAWDGVHLSNTCRLIREFGFGAVLIEGDPERCGAIRSNFPGRDDVIAVQGLVGFETGVDTVDTILSRTPIPLAFDLISIDVDGIDWHIWDSIVVYRPRVVVIEFNPTVGNDVVFVQDRDMAINEGASLSALAELGRRKGYELVAVTKKNALFAIAEEFEKFGIEDNSVHAMWDDQPNHIFSCYNGKIYHTMTRLGWHSPNFDLRPDGLQFLSEFRFKGAVQGRAADCRGTFKRLTDSPGAADLTTARAILAEVHELRVQRTSMDKDEFARRSAEAWTAARIYLATAPQGTMDGGAAEDEPVAKRPGEAIRGRGSPWR